MEGCVQAICEMIVPTVSYEAFVIVGPTGSQLPGYIVRFIPIATVAEFRTYKKDTIKNLCSRGQEDMFNTVCRYYAKLANCRTVDDFSITVVRTVQDRWFVVHVPESMQRKE